MSDPHPEIGDLLSHEVPADLLELYEILEWHDAVERRAFRAPRATGGFVSRAQWNAAAPKPGILTLTPTFGATVHYEGPQMGAYIHDRCATMVRGIQAFHMATPPGGRGWLDIAYTTIVCRHGYIFEGRWIGHRTAANGTNAGNEAAYAVCVLMGQGDELTPEAEEAVARAITGLQQIGRAGPNINGHRDWLNTACPGDVVYHDLDTIRARVAQLNEPTPAPAPPTPSEDDTMKPVAGTPSWAKRQPDKARPRFVALYDQPAGNTIVASVDNAVFTPAWKEGQRTDGWQDVFWKDLWWRRFFNTGEPYKFDETDDGAYFLIAEHGTYDVAQRPATGASVTEGSTHHG